MIPLESFWLKPSSASKQNSKYLPGTMKTIEFQTGFVPDFVSDWPSVVAILLLLIFPHSRLRKYFLFMHLSSKQAINTSKESWSTFVYHFIQIYLTIMRQFWPILGKKTTCNYIRIKTLATVKRHSQYEW